MQKSEKKIYILLYLNYYLNNNRQYLSQFNLYSTIFKLLLLLYINCTVPIPNLYSTIFKLLQYFQHNLYRHYNYLYSTIFKLLRYFNKSYVGNVKYLYSTIFKLLRNRKNQVYFCSRFIFYYI